ncbi:MAG: ACP S-malonyltransferase [Anaerolineae bacterium]|jgi:[acyl-carrier-protein] S-malonyltransferase|nr:ACP S-malonyltransferase [Chloroflexota bacterium]
MSGLAIVFPGQGSQFVGMGSLLRERVPAARERFAQADALLGIPLTEICQQGPAEALNDTALAQPAIYATTVALWEYLCTVWPADAPILGIAGHSLGEFAALTAAGALAFEQGLLLVQQRGQAMAAAGAAEPGGMLAILGLGDELVQDLVREAQACNQPVWVANYNAPGQVVVAGAHKGLAALQSQASGHKGCRVMPLAVSVACHTPLMGPAANALSRALADTPLTAARIPVISNVTAEPVTDPEEIRQALLQQLVSPVRWVQSVRKMRELGADTILEVGPKSVLTGMIKRIDPEVAVTALTDVAAIDEWVAARKEAAP